MKNAIIPALLSSLFLTVFAAGCVSPESVLPAYDPEAVVVSEVLGNIPEGSTKVIKREVADCGEVTVDIFSATMDLPNHFHRKSNEIAIFLEGTGEFIFEGRAPILIKPGTVIFIPKNQQHSFKNGGGRYTLIRIFAPHFESNDRIKVEDEK
jgi:quercetin dioxygenase-like cupin family protein